jgi:hypothetical protein
MATAEKDVPSRFGDGLSHSSKVRNIKRDAKRFAELATAVSKLFLEFSKR